MPGSSTTSPLARGPNWRRSFRKPRGGRYASSAQPTPVLGTNRGAPWALFNAGFGPVYGYRGYNYPGTGVPASCPGPDCPIPPGLPAGATVISIVPDITQTLAGTLDSALAAYFASVPPGAYVCAWAEAELNGYGTASQNVAGLARLYGIFNANAPASASFGQIVAATSAIPGNGGYPLTPWVSAPANGGLVLDFYGMDVGFTNATTTMSFTVQSAIAMMAATGVPQSGPWSLTEVAYNPTWHGSQNQWYSDGWNVAQAIGAIHYLCFFGSGGANIFWPISNRNSLPVLQDIAALSRGDPRSPPASTIARSTTAPFTSSAGTTSLTATFGSNPAAGSKILVAIQAPSGATITVSDNGTTGGTFWLDACCLNSSGSIPSVFVYRADNITLPGSGTYAVTVTLGASAALQVAASAYTGLQNGPPTNTSSVTSSGNNPALSPVTPGDVSSLFFSAFFCTSAASPESMSLASGYFTAQQAQASGTSNFPGAIADAIVTSPAPQQGGWYLPDAPNWSAVMAAYGAFPANVQIVPGAEMTWANAVPPTTGVTVNAGVASASGWAAINALGTLATAGLAAATGTAQPAAVSQTAIPGTAPAPAAAVDGTAQLTVTAGLAAGTGAAPFTPGDTISLTLTALAPVGAAAAALDATVTIFNGINAGLASATASALQTSGHTAGLASAGAAALQAGGQNAAPAVATGTAQSPAVTVTVTAGVAAGTGAAQAVTAAGNPAAGLASASGTGLQAGGQNAGLAAAAGAALNATVTTGGTANAGLAAATGAAVAPAVTAAPSAATAPATGTSLTAVANVLPAAGMAAGSGAALQAGGQNAALASASGSALQPTVITGIAPTATTAAGTGAAAAPAVTVTVTAGLAASTGTSQNPTTTAVFTTGLPSATGAAAAPAVTVTVAAGLAASTGASLAVTPTAGMNPTQAAATGAALPAGITILVTATTAAGTASGLNATVATGGTANAGLAAATGSGLTTAISAAASSNLAAAMGGAQQVPATVSPAATVASASGAAKQSGLGALAGLGAATGTSLTTGVTFSPAALAAISTAAAQQPTVIAAPAVVKGVATTGVTDSNPGTTGVTGSTMAGTVS